MHFFCTLCILLCRSSPRLELVADLVAPEAFELNGDLIEMLEVRDRNPANFLQHGQLPLEQPVHHFGDGFSFIGQLHPDGTLVGAGALVMNVAALEPR